jgi:uncharacterized membrane protein
MLKKGLWVLFIFLSVAIALLATIPFFIEDKVGIMNMKTDELLANKVWLFGLYTHIISGGISLFVGWFLFIKKIRNKYLSIHRNIGKIYVVAALIAALSGIFIGFYATGGLIASAGFISLGIIWFYSTLNAYLHIKNRRISQHETMMIYSYALCFAAVTLRLYLSLSAALGIEFVIAYKFIAWFSWLPNLLIAYLLTRQQSIFKIGDLETIN